MNPKKRKFAWTFQENTLFIFGSEGIGMVLLGFSVLKEKLLEGSKTQTIRAPRQRPFKVGDRLEVYWKV